MTNEDIEKANIVCNGNIFKLCKYAYSLGVAHSKNITDTLVIKEESQKSQEYIDGFYQAVGQISLKQYKLFKEYYDAKFYNNIRQY